MQKNVTEWLDRTAERFPDRTAIVDAWETLSFGAYRRKALAIAHALISHGVGPREPVAVYMEKSAKVLVSFLGAAYSGNFYSPIDVEMPSSRVDKILEILQPKAVITTAELKERFAAFGYSGEYILYEDIQPSEADERFVRPVADRILDTDLLYVLFTSGSTGTPKGVGIQHRAVIDYIDWVVEEFDITEEDSFGNQAPFYFDNSILDIYSTLKTGAALYVIPKELFSNPVRLLEFLKENRIDTIFWVPTALIMVARLRALKKVDIGGTLKRVLFCGEVMPNKELNRWREAVPDAVYANLYGPTEITDVCAFYRIDRIFDDSEALPIGRPMRNTEILLLDDKDRLIHPEDRDAVGELCVRGTCLSVGYYRNPEKTREAFVQNPLNDRYEEKIYRTGDLASYNERGELIYVGRKDFQIKHLGNRIELGEIETAVSSLADIDRCCCAYDQKHSRIVLFVVSEQQVARTEIQERLSKLLPVYMVPEKVIQLEEMPLNANGKIDRNRLKEML